QIHADERDVNILERAYFGNGLRVAGEIEALAAIGDNVTVACALRVKEFAGRGAAHQIVRRDRLDRELAPRLRFSIAHHGRVGNELVNSGWRPDLGAGLAD